MLKVTDGGCSRRELLRIGALGFAGLALPSVLAAKSRNALLKDRSVVLLFLNGGPSHIETFDPKMTAPSEIRSVTGEVRTTLPGVTFGGTFPRLASLARKLAVLRNFGHTSSDHNDGKRIMTSGVQPELYNRGRMEMHRDARMNEIASRLYGAADPRSGIPAGIVAGATAISSAKDLRVDEDNFFRGSGELGASHLGFNPADRSHLMRDMELALPEGRFEDRVELMKRLDGLRRSADGKGVMEGMDAYNQQAVQVLLGGVSEAFDLSKEAPKTLEAYDTSRYSLPATVDERARRRNTPAHLGKQMLLARRLCERGARFVTVVSSGWDHHGDRLQPGNNMVAMMPPMGGAVDKAASAFIEDCEARGLSDKILLVITGEFGRTPRLGPQGGRDHWGELTPVALYGGGLKTGQVIGESDRHATQPNGQGYAPQHLLATIMHSLFDLGELRLVRGLPDTLVRRITEVEPIRELV